jgi:hypothetical protein
MRAIRSRHIGRLAVCGVLAAAAVAAVPQFDTTAADHRDGPIFVNTAQNGRADCNDIYIFQAPGNPANTVMIFNVSPFPGGGGGTPATFDQTVIFDIKLDNTGDAIEDLTFRATFGAPDSNGSQAVTLRGLPSTRFPPTGILASGRTGQNLTVRGGGMFRAAVQDDPFFFDATAFGVFAADGAGGFPRPVGQAANFFGPDGNTLSIILEIPTSRILSTRTSACSSAPSGTACNWTGWAGRPSTPSSSRRSRGTT